METEENINCERCQHNRASHRVEADGIVWLLCVTCRRPKMEKAREYSEERIIYPARTG